MFGTVIALHKNLRAKRMYVFRFCSEGLLHDYVMVLILIIAQCLIILISKSALTAGLEPLRL